jgi:hypothetical protein
MQLDRIFILYSERSGSNLLRVLLGNHPALSAPVPPQFFDSFIPFADRFGTLTKKQHAIRLISLMKEYANHPFSDWQLSLPPEEIYSIFSPANFIQIVDALYGAKAKQDNRSGYVCKENHLFRHAGLIAHNFDVSWLYLHRDPRDVVSSWLKKNILFFTAYEAAHSWKEEQQKCIALDRGHNVDYHKLSYEELITDPEQTMSSVLQYLDKEIDERCFQNQQQRTEAKRNILWKNLDNPIDSSNKKNYTNTLSQKQLRIVESVCKHQMQTLGYQLETDGDWTPAIGKTKYQYYNKVKELIKKTVLGRNETLELIQDRDKLKNELINGIS